mmetsp:Transcript_16287/g.50561  ORF Transcript_16287/g.50561 Transcript_16287/m.50561 type:complete len:334 (+) Transcript_16287:83-1084(+)
MECLAQQQGRGDQVRGALRLPVQAAAADGADARGAIRPAALQELRGVPEPVRPRRLPGQAVDLPILLHAQPLPHTLREHLARVAARRAVPQLHHYRVHRAAAQPAAARLPLRAGCLPARARARGGARQPYAGALAAARECARGPHHLRHARARARAGLCRVCQVVCLPRQRDVHARGRRGAAGPHRRRRGAAGAGRDRHAGGRPGRRGALPAPCVRVRIPAHHATGGAYARCLSCAARAAAGAVHGARAGSGHRAAGFYCGGQRRPHSAAAGGPRHRGPGHRCQPGECRRCALVEGHQQGLGALLQQGAQVLRGAGTAARGKRARAGRLCVCA